MQIRVRIRRKLTQAVIALTAGALALSACSSSGGAASAKSGGSTPAGAAVGDATAACVSRANAFLESWQTPPTKLSATYTPLAAKPPTGKLIIKLTNGLIPSDGDSYKQEALAAQAIGWRAKNISFNGTVEDLNAKFEQAVSDKPAVIALSGWAIASISKPLEDAKKASIIVELSSILDQPTSNPGFASLSNAGPTVATIAQIEANWFMADSNCTGSLAAFGIPFPIVDFLNKKFNDVVKANCPKCTVKNDMLQASDIGTPKATKQIISALQSEPKIKYVQPGIANVATGLASALSTAGIPGVKIFGSVPDPNAIKALQDGTNAMWVDQSALLQGWTELDAALRALESGKTVTDTGGYPLAMLTHDNVPSGSAVPVYPADFQAEFKALWHVG